MKLNTDLNLWKKVAVGIGTVVVQIVLVTLIVGGVPLSLYLLKTGVGVVIAIFVPLIAYVLIWFYLGCALRLEGTSSLVRAGWTTALGVFPLNWLAMPVFFYLFVLPGTRDHVDTSVAGILQHQERDWTPLMKTVIGAITAGILVYPFLYLPSELASRARQVGLDSVGYEKPVFAAMLYWWCIYIGLQFFYVHHIVRRLRPTEQRLGAFGVLLFGIFIMPIYFFRRVLAFNHNRGAAST